MRLLITILVSFFVSCTATEKTVSLDGTGSFSPEGSALTYKWKQIKGANTPLFGESNPVVPITLKKGSFAWELTVTDTLGYSGKDTVYYVSN